MISKEKLDFAVRQVVENCLHVKKGDKTMVVTDLETKHIGMAIAEKMKQVAGNVKVFVMEDYGKRPEDGVNSLKFPEEIGKAFAEVDVSAYVAQGKKNEYATFRVPMLAAINGNKNLRHGHMIFINDMIMEQGMSADYSMIQRVSKQVYDIVSKAKKIRVTTALGTDMTAEFDPTWRWVNGDGNMRPGFWSNLPDGEVFTCPKTINGVAVVDGVLGDHLAPRGTIEKHPVTVKFRNGRVTEIACSNKEIEDDLRKYIAQTENADRVGEFAIGTNIGLKSLIGNLLQDEKFPSVHFAVGSSHKEHTGADWDSEVHMDMIILHTTIEVDGRVIMRDGKFKL
jgi:leucyl aminopeptidase (aminopeptidase T)